MTGLPPLQTFARVFFREVDEIPSPSDRTLNVDLFFKFIVLIKILDLRLRIKLHTTGNPTPAPSEGGEKLVIAADLGLPSEDLPSWLVRNFFHDLPDERARGFEGAVRDCLDGAGEDWEDGIYNLKGHLNRGDQWQMFDTVGDGYLGYGPRMARPGDVLCVLGHCNLPVLLRKVDERFHKVVGACVVEGLMLGEAARLLGEGAPGLKLETFELI
jgi:hypothetical protein